MVEVSRARFEELVGEALDTVPERLAELIDNCVVLVEEEPPADDPELLGIYDGTPLTERDSSGRTLTARLTTTRIAPPTGFEPVLPP